MRIRILTVSVLRFGIIPHFRGRVLAQESLHASQLRHTNQYEMKMRSHLHFTPLLIKLSGVKR